MSAELVASLGPNDFNRETDLGNDPGIVLVQSPREGDSTSSTQCDLRGLSLPKYQRGNLAVYGYTSSFRIPHNLTMSTGLTFKIYLSDDGTSPVDLGLVVQLGITLKRCIANSTFDIDTSGAAEVTGNVTLSSTTGGACIASIAIATASLPSSTAVGDVLLMRLRRVGTAAADTLYNRAIFYRVDVENT